MGDYESDDGYHTESEYLAHRILPCKITEGVSGDKPEEIPVYMDRVDEAFGDINHLNRHVPTVFAYPMLLACFQAEDTRKECPRGSDNLDIIQGLCNGWVMHSSFADDYATTFTPPCPNRLTPEFLSAWSRSRDSAILLFSTFACDPVAESIKHVEEDYELLTMHTSGHCASEKLYEFRDSLEFKIKKIPVGEREGLLVEFLVFMKDLCSRLAADGQAAGSSPSDVASTIDGAGDESPRVGDKRPFEGEATE